MLLPALGRAKRRAQGVYCMSNTRQIMLAWHMYAADNSDWLVPNEDNCNAGGWISGCLDFNGANIANYSVDFLLNPRYARLGPYTKSAGVYKCPADRSTVNYMGQTYSRVRSVSMSQAVGTQLQPPLQAVAGPWLDGTHNYGQTTWRTYGRLGDITQPSPAMLWVVLDEHPDGINDGGLAVDCADTNAAAKIIDFPASFHAGACGFAFSDGHSEIHRWKDQRTMPPVHYANDLQLNIASPDNPDVAWMQIRTSAPK